MKRGEPTDTIRSFVRPCDRRVDSEEVYLRLYTPLVPPSRGGKAVQYAHRLTQGMQAKKYKGGVAAKAKASSTRLFEQYFKPLT